MFSSSAPILRRIGCGLNDGHASACQDEDKVEEFVDTRSSNAELTTVCTSSVKYDLVGEIAKGAKLTRRSVVKILQGINESKFYLFKNNPEDFIRIVIRIIKE